MKLISSSLTNHLSKDTIVKIIGDYAFFMEATMPVTIKVKKSEDLEQVKISKSTGGYVTFSGVKEIELDEAKIKAAIGPPIVGNLTDGLGQQVYMDSEKVDRFIELKEELKMIEPKIKEMESLRKVLQSIAEGNFPPEDKAVIVGETGSVEFKPASTKRVVKDMQGLVGALKAKVGYPALLDLISIPFKDIDTYLSIAESDPFLDKETGARTLAGYKLNDPG